MRLGTAASILVLLALASAPARAIRTSDAEPRHSVARIDLAARPASLEERRDTPGLRALEQDTGSRWRLWWDPWTGNARRGLGGYAPSGFVDAQEAARDFRDRHAALLGARDAELESTRWKRGANSWHATWQQRHAGDAVVGCVLDLTLDVSGHVVAFRSSLVPVPSRAVHGDVDASQARAACEVRVGEALHTESARRVWVPEPLAGRYVLTSAWELELRNTHGARWLARVDATSSRLLLLDSLLRLARFEGVASGDIKPLYADDASETQRFAWLALRLHGTSAEPATTFASAQGSYHFTVPGGDYDLASDLDGRFVAVSNDAVGEAWPTFERSVAVPGQLDVHWDTSNSRDDERTIYFHTNIIHDYVRKQFDFEPLDFPVPAVAAVRNPNNGNPDYANAFWDGTRMGFGNGGGAFLNFGLFADVIYHEYTHAITDYAYRPGGGLIGPMGAAIHEGLSDYFACTLTNESRIGERLRGGADALRDLDHELLWPEDRDPGDEPHVNGLILAGALWHTREIVGADVADPIIHFARDIFPDDYDAYLDAILLQDDLIFGDGIPGNGSPHRDAILAAFARHGMGPLAVRDVRIHHLPLRDVEQAGEARSVRAGVGSLLPGLVDGMELHWRADGAAFAIETMQLDENGDYVAEIPGQPVGTRVDYWIRSFKRRPFEEKRLPEDAPKTLFSFHVGPDEIAPVITHAVRSEVPAFAWPIDLQLRIEDNLGLAYAFLQYTLNGEPGSSVGLRRSQTDPTLFTTRFPNVGGAVGDVIEYWITAVDASQAEHRSRFPAEGGVRMQLVRDLVEDFEPGAAAWTHAPIVAGRPDAWHVTSHFNHTTGGRQAWWCGSTVDEYPTSTAAALVTDWYRIDPGAEARVWSWIDAEENGPLLAFDGGIVEVQGEGAALWQALEPRSGYTHRMSDTAGSNVLLPGTPCLSGSSDGWQRLEFDLTPWAGERVRLRFVFGSDNVGSFSPLQGWLLDDFQLDAGLRDPTDASEPRGVVRRRVLNAPPWPNPFNPRLTFDLQVPSAAGHLRLEIHDARGRLVSRLIDGEVPDGTRRVVWRGDDLSGREVASGTYYYRLISILGEEKGRVVLLR